MRSMVFVHPWALAIGAAVIALLALYQIFLARSRQSTIVFSDISAMRRIPPSPFVRLRRILPALRIVAIALLFVGLARPQSKLVTKDVSTEGIDIMLILDTSGSMKERDFVPNNRLTVAKSKIGQFIRGREADRIGLIVFAEKAFTQCPLTQDYAVLLQLLDRIDFGLVGDSTAIGEALALGVERLRSSTAKSKVMVLLTDGQNNTGRIQPLTAAKLAEQYKIKVYTIGVGRPGPNLDEQALSSIAQMTGGEYFRATNPRDLETIYKRIDQMEKTKVESKDYTEYSELFRPFVMVAFALLLLEAALAGTRFRRLS